MQRVAVFACIALTYCFTLAVAAAVATIPDGQIVTLEQRATKDASTSAGEFAKDLLEAAKVSIGEAKINFAAGKEKVAARQLEMANIQLTAAEAKGVEKELLEKIAVRRSELRKMEAQLERFRQGEEN